jgi:hypothetical protein
MYLREVIMKLIHSLAFVMLTLLATACGNNQQPTAVANTPLPPTETSIPPTLNPPTSTPDPTNTPIPTLAPTTTAVPNTLVAPDTVQADADLSLSGSWDLHTAVSLHITIHISDWLLAEGTVSINEDGTWELVLPLPPQISGTATIDLFPDDSAVAALSSLLIIQANLNENNTYVTLNSPAVGETAVAGYAIFFQGVVNKPIRRTLVMGILHDGCSRLTASQIFELGSGSWSGFSVLPADITLGPACAIARTGDPETDEEWAAALVPLTIYAPDDDAATTIKIGNPGELVFTQGETVLLYGTAVNALNNKVGILLNSDDGTFRLLTEQTTSVNSYGYWEVEITLPDNYTGFALLTVSMGTGNTYFEHRTPVTITR